MAGAESLMPPGLSQRSPGRGIAEPLPQPHIAGPATATRRTGPRLLDRYTLGQITWFIHVAFTQKCNMVGQQLQRNHAEDGS